MEQRGIGATIDALEEAPFEVVGDNIIVELVEIEEELASGIVLAGSSKKRPPEVVVVGVGPLAKVAVDADTADNTHDEYGNPSRTIRVGDVLVVSKHELQRIELSDDGRELHRLKPSAVIGIV